MFGWNYISLNTVGFAQVGRPDYEQRVATEKAVINAFYNTDDRLKIPEEFVFLAHFKWVLCPHDFGSYWDFQIHYYEDEIYHLEESDDQSEVDKFERFYDWLNTCENTMGQEDEQIQEWCDLLYQKNVTMTVVHKQMEEFTGLKKVQ